MADTPKPPHERGEEILNVRTEMMRRRGAMAAAIDHTGAFLAHPFFLLGLLALHLGWVVVNIRALVPFEPWDPYPFVFLATIASAEAPFISLLILMRQRRDGRIEELREEIELQVSLHMEKKLTHVVRVLGRIQDKLGVEAPGGRALLTRHEEELDPQRLLEILEAHLEESESDPAT